MIAQIIIVDLIFSLDSVVTAVGMARDIRVMITAMLIAVSVMGFFFPRPWASSSRRTPR